MLRPKLNRIWATTNSVSRRDPGDAKYIQGWISEIPTYQVLNYLQYKVDTTLLALAERGVFEWGGDVQYGLNSVVWNELDRKIYVAIVGNPDKTKAPSANLSQWSQSSIQIPRASYDAVAAAITAHIADITGNPHQLTAGRLGAYNKAEIDALVLQYRQLVAAHAGDKSNPHGVTATQAGAVPITGGTYTGDVIFNGGLFFDSGKINQVSKTNGLYLQTGNFVLGINASGVAVAGTTTNQSPIVSEQTFPGLKALNEPNYAAHAPSFQATLQQTLTILRGIGLINTTFIPTYSPVSGAMSISSDVGKILNHIGQTIPADATDWTLGFDIMSTTVAPATSNAAVVLSIQGKGYITIRDNGGIYAGLTTDATPGFSVGQMDSWTRIVLVAKGTTTALYVDGKLVSSNAAAIVGTTGGSLRLVSYSRGASARQFYVRNARVWQSIALTPQQVSTL